jgi:hypothetical protein
VTGRRRRVVRRGKGDLLQLRGQIAVVIAGNVGTKTAEAESLKQMGLPEIADVIEHAPRLVPMEHRPDVAGEQQKARQTAEDS